MGACHSNHVEETSVCKFEGIDFRVTPVGRGKTTAAGHEPDLQEHGFKHVPRNSKHQFSHKPTQPT